MRRQTLSPPGPPGPPVPHHGALNARLRASVFPAPRETAFRRLAPFLRYCLVAGGCGDFAAAAGQAPHSHPAAAAAAFPSLLHALLVRAASAPSVSAAVRGGILALLTDTLPCLGAGADSVRLPRSAAPLPARPLASLRG